MKSIIVRVCPYFGILVVLHQRYPTSPLPYMEVDRKHQSTAEIIRFARIFVNNSHPVIQAV